MGIEPGEVEALRDALKAAIARAEAAELRAAGLEVQLAEALERLRRASPDAGPEDPTAEGDPIS